MVIVTVMVSSSSSYGPLGLVLHILEHALHCGVFTGPQFHVIPEFV